MPLFDHADLVGRCKTGRHLPCIPVCGQRQRVAGIASIGRVASRRISATCPNVSEVSALELKRTQPSAISVTQIPVIDLDCRGIWFIPKITGNLTAYSHSKTKVVSFPPRYVRHRPGMFLSAKRSYSQEQMTVALYGRFKIRKPKRSKIKGKRPGRQSSANSVTYPVRSAPPERTNRDDGQDYT